MGRKLCSLIVPVVLLVCLLSGCGGTTEIELMNTQLTIEFQGNSRGTVTTESGDVYEFDFERDVCEITYPDGKTYSNATRVLAFDSSVSESGNGVSVEISPVTEYVNVYQGDQYLSTGTLADAIKMARPASPSNIPVLPILLIILVTGGGVLTIVYARQIAELHLVMRVRGRPDPSDEFVGATRFSGVLLIIAGIVLLVMLVRNYI